MTITGLKKYPHIISEGEEGYQRCTFCIMDTTDPLIEFDENGRCNHCRQVEEWKKNWNPAGNPQKLEQMIERIRKDGQGKEYDLILGLSGGVDSSYVAYLAKQYNLRALVVHCDTGWNSELAVKNIENIVSKCGFDLVTHVVDWEEMRDLQHAFFKSGVPNQDIPQDHAIYAVFASYAFKHKIKWSLIGSNLATESILPKAWGYMNKDLKHIKAIHKRFGTVPLKKFPTMSFAEYGIKLQILGGLNFAEPLNLIPYNKSEAMETLTREFGWKYYGGKHYESRFTKFFQAWYLPTKWGYDKRLAHLSSLVASGEMTREQALHEFQTGTLPVEDIESDKEYMARKLGISRDEFETLMNVERHEHTDYPRSNMQLLKVFALANRALRILKGQGRTK